MGLLAAVEQRARWVRFRRRRDLWYLAAALATAALAVNTLNHSATLALGAGAAYLVFMFMGLRAALRERTERDQLARHAVAALFKFMNDRLFDSRNDTRFTFFVPHETLVAQGSTEVPIVPWVRFRVGGFDPIREAESSNVQYLPGEGITGFAYAEPRDHVHLVYFPPFETREQMALHYVEEMHVQQNTANQLSRYNRDVRAILAYGFVDSEDRMLGVMTVDFTHDIEHIELDVDRIEEMLVLIQGVLQSINSPH
ncbi:MAG: hypothetical protein KAY24_06995 [Candidatus Eisenbacteria sp.]|nr:hypothetical protein [Candidatus Eisenbacteria bacterium]